MACREVRDEYTKLTGRVHGKFGGHEGGRQPAHTESLWGVGGLIPSVTKEGIQDGNW